MSGTFGDPTNGQGGDGFMSGLINTLGDPGVFGMLSGLTRGAAQAAMPTRMPIPTGAALGLAASGLQEGQNQAYQGQYLKQKATAEQLGNIGTAAQLPVLLSQNRMLQQVYSDPALMGAVRGAMQRMSGAPMGVPSVTMAPSSAAPVSPAAVSSMGSPTAAVAGGRSPMNVGQSQTPSGSPWSLMNVLPPEQQKMVQLASQATGMPADLLANHKWNESRTTLTPTEGDGGASFGVMQMQGPTLDSYNQMHGTNYTVQQLKADPQLALNVGAGHWMDLKQQYGSPFLASMAYARGPGATDQWLKNGADFSQLPQGVREVLGNVYGPGSFPGAAPIQPALFAVRAQTPGAVGSPIGQVNQPGVGADASALATSQGYQQQANDLHLLQMLKIPIPGDEATLRTTAQKYLDLALTAPKAFSEAMAKAQVEAATTGTIETQKGLAKAATTPFNDRFGNIYIGDGKGGFTYLGRGSEVKPVWNNTTGQMEYGDVGGAGIGAMPGNMAGSAGAGGGRTSTGAQAVAPPPTQFHFMEERGKDLAEQYQKIDSDAASAKEGNYLFDNLRNDSQTWQMGRFADWEGEGRAWLSAVAHQFNLPFEGDKPLADYQAFLKSSGALLRTAVHDTSSRAAVQEYNLIGQTLPQPTSSSQAFSQIADQWQGANDFRLAKQKFAAGYQGHPQDFNVDFNTNVSPTSFMLNRMSQTPQGQADMHDMLGRMQATAEGRMAARHMLTQYRYAKQYGLFENLSPTGSEAENAAAQPTNPMPQQPLPGGQ